MGWPGPMTHRQWLAWMEWQSMKHRSPDEPAADLSMDGLVPEETQRRWADKVAASKFMVAEANARAAAALERGEVSNQRN